MSKPRRQKPHRPPNRPAPLAAGVADTPPVSHGSVEDPAAAVPAAEQALANPEIPSESVAFAPEAEPVLNAAEPESTVAEPALAACEADAAEPAPASVTAGALLPVPIPEAVGVPVPALAPRLLPAHLSAESFGTTVMNYVIAEGEAFAVHMRDLAGARSMAEFVRLQIGEFQRRADATLTCWGVLAVSASRTATAR